MMFRATRRSLPRFAPLLFALLLQVGCATTETVVSLQNVSCGSCGASIEKVVGRYDGVKSVTYRLTEAEVAVRHDPEVIAPAAILQAVVDGGYDAVLGAGHGTYVPPETFEKGLDVSWLTETGAEVDIESALVKGKFTVIDFGATWCAPCREVDKRMKRILAARSDVALRKIDVVDWDSPVARQHLRQVDALPYLIVYSPSGKRVAVVAGQKFDELEAALTPGSEK